MPDGLDAMGALEKKALEAVRRGLDIHGRTGKAAEFKAEANEHFASEDWRSGVVSYLAGIWFLQRGEPPCPLVIVSRSDSLSGVVDALGDGVSSEEEDERGASERQELRVTLHLNLAAAALKLEEWEVARMACEYVFGVQGFGAPSKAFFRLAKAHAGEGSFPEARALLERLLASEPRNGEAAALLDEVRRRQTAEEGKLSTPKVEHLRGRVEAAGAAARPPVELEKMTGVDFARLSEEEQRAMVEEISRGLDEEGGGEGAQNDFDMAALTQVLGSRAAKA